MRFVKIYRWIILSVLLQLLFLAYVNFYYLGEGGPVKATLYQPEKEVARRNVRLPAGAGSVRTSVSGRFCAYLQDGGLNIFDLDGRKVLKTWDAAAGKVTFFRWLPDRDMLIYSVNSQEKGKPVIKVTTYDAGSGYEQSYPSPKNLPAASEVTDITASPLTNIVYVKVKTGDKTARILSYNIMDEMKTIMNTGVNTVIMETLYSDMLIYQDDKFRIFTRNGKTGSVKQLPYKGKMVLLGVDSEDKVFVGELDSENKVTGIFYGKLDIPADRWQKVVPAGPVPQAKLLITSDGEIYENDEQNSSLKGVGLERKISYKGEFVEITGSFVVTRDERTLRLSAVKQAQ